MAKITQFLPSLKSTSLFRDVSEAQLNRLIEKIEVRELKEGEYLFKEGALGRNLFLIEDGCVQVLKNNPYNSELILIASLSRGEIVGELGFIQGETRDASIRALEPTRFLEIELRSELDDPIYNEVRARMSGLLAQRLKQANLAVLKHTSLSIEHSKARAVLGNLILHLMVLVFLYIFSVQLISILNIGIFSTSIISIPVLSVFGISVFSIMKFSGYPLSMYGFKFKKIGKVISESLLLTIPLVLFVIAGKWGLINYFSRFKELPFFDLNLYSPNGIIYFGSFTFNLLLVFYCLFVPVQEIIFRGAIQSSLNHFILGKHRMIKAILISNLPYSIIHLHVSFYFALVAYFFGLYWGWMYGRQKSLVGCTISHFIIGILTFFILGAQQIFVV